MNGHKKISTKTGGDIPPKIPPFLTVSFTFFCTDSSVVILLFNRSMSLFRFCTVLVISWDISTLALLCDLVRERDTCGTQPFDKISLLGMYFLESGICKHKVQCEKHSEQTHVCLTFTSIVSMYSSSLMSDSTSFGVGETDGEELKLEISLEGDPSREAETVNYENALFYYS